MTRPRCSGVLLHPTSLPGPYGIGDLGPRAGRWLEWLAGTGCTFWQTLPLGPTGYGDSPYCCFSAFAGNPYLVSPELLVADGSARGRRPRRHPRLPRGPGRLRPGHPLEAGPARRAFARFREGPPGRAAGRYRAFRRAHAGWLDDYALFMALKEAHGGGPGRSGRRRCATGARRPGRARAALAHEVERQAFRQFLFFGQWERLREQARAPGPADHGRRSHLRGRGQRRRLGPPRAVRAGRRPEPRVVAGVPPDYFTETGQLWGNPLYDWDRHAADGYAWWIARLRSLLELTDLVRIDHFRASWTTGRYPPAPPPRRSGAGSGAPGPPSSSGRGGPGRPAHRGRGPGRAPPGGPRPARAGLPGMKVLQFAYDGDPANPFLPEHHPRTASSTPAPTTTTPPWAGTARCAPKSAGWCAPPWEARGGASPGT